MITNGSSTHVWKFFRAGGFDQVRFETGADLVNLPSLDQKLWAALSCPTRGLELDPKTLDLLDLDKDGRIRVPEILAAVTWGCAMVKNPDVLLRSGEQLELNAINDSHPEGKALLASAKQILVNLGKKDATSISVDDASDTAKIFAQTQFNGDGVIPAEAAEDAPTKALIADIIPCLGAENDRSARPGVSQAKVDQFFADAAAYSDWVKKSETDAANILPLGDKTADALGAFKAVKGKVDDFFTRCRLAAFDPRSLAAVNRSEAEYVALATKEMSSSAAEVAGFPIASIAAGKALPSATESTLRGPPPSRSSMWRWFRRCLANRRASRRQGGLRLPANSLLTKHGWEPRPVAQWRSWACLASVKSSPATARRRSRP